MMLDTARRYRDLGLAPIPLWPRTKVPAVQYGQLDQLPSDEQLREWFAKEDRNIGILCGEVSGNLVVRDFDDVGAFHAWSCSHPELANRLPQAITARGRHVYCRVDADPTGGTNFADGELKWTNQYVTAPESVHVSGHTYSWVQPLEQPRTINLSASGLGYEWLAKRRNVGNAGTEDIYVPMFHGDVKVAIARCIPPGPGNRHRCLFRLARELKAIPDIACLEGKALEEIVRRWHHVSLPYIATKPFAASWPEFLDAWQSVKYPAGVNPVTDAWTAAQLAETPSEAQSFDDAAAVALLKLCRELQRMQGERPFYLDCRKAGELTGLDHVTAWRYLRGFVALGLLELTQPGGRHRANQYRYRGEMT